MSEEAVKKYGERWDENDPALALYDRWRKSDKGTKIRAALNLLSDSGRTASNELARAAAVLVLKEKDVPTSLIRTAWTSHKFLIKDARWLDTFPNPSKAHEELRKELMELKDRMFDSAVDYHIEASTKDLSFDDFLAEALASLLESDPDLKQAHLAAKLAATDASKEHGNSISHVKAVFVPLVIIGLKTLHSEVASGSVPFERLFTDADIDAVSVRLASDFAQEQAS